MSTTAPETLPLEVGQLGNFEVRMLRTFRAVVEDWDEVCSALGAWEALHLTDDNAISSEQQHRVWVRNLLAWGELVQRATQHPGFPDQALAARVNARLHHLEDKLALWHRAMTLADEERILQAAFP